MADNPEAEQLRAVLDDTQASLAAALARIEAFRIREKQLMTELSALRNQVHGSGALTSSQSVPPNNLAATTAQPSPAAAVSQAVVSASAPQAQSWSSPSAAPVYVTNCDGDYPVHIIQGAKKVPGGLVVTKEYIDFVEVKARIKQEEFMGITTLKASTKGKADVSGQDGTSTSEAGVWQMLWNKGGVPQRMAFEASNATRESLHRHTERWLGEVDTGQDLARISPQPTADSSGDQPMFAPLNLTAGEATLNLLGEPSLILTPDRAGALASHIPPLQRMKDWTLSYSTSKHGISLQTLFRKQTQGHPTIWLVKDFGGYVFGCYTADSWRVAPRFYGTGETFVFQLEPYKVAYPWRPVRDVKNDFFMYGTPECIAVGGLGHFAIWVDSELKHGSSGVCGTFGSPCLAHNEEFRIQVMEMWQVTH